MTIEELKKFESNKSRFEELYLCDRNDIVPFIGAGVSKGCGFYTWNELVRRVADNYLTADEYEALSARLDNMELVDELIALVNGNVTAVKKRIADLIINCEFHQTNVTRSLVSGFSKCMITTNYDRVLEEALALHGESVPVILPVMADQTAGALQDKKGCILKLHGTVEELSSMILAREDYMQAYGPEGTLDVSRPVPLALSLLFAGKRILFAGCSLEKDRTLEVLSRVIHQNHHINHYAVLPCPSDAREKNALNIRLDALGILPVFYPEGRHECLEIILNDLIKNSKTSRTLPQDTGGKRWSRRLVQVQKEREANQVILPWMRSSAGFRAVFPDLFIPPRIQGIKSRTRLFTEHLLKEFGERNLVITGNAGSGKTTLLKYLFLFENPGDEILYLHASALAKKECSGYEEGVIGFLLGRRRAKTHKLILLDGIDEEFLDKPEEVYRLLEQMGKNRKIHVWIGWRKDHYNSCENEALNRFFYETAEILDWTQDMARDYIHNYCTKLGLKGVAERAEELMTSGDEVRELMRSPFHVVLMLYLIEAEREQPPGTRCSGIQSLYGLYETFFCCWWKKEKSRGTTRGSLEEIRTYLWQAAEATYYGGTCLLENEDSAAEGLLYIDNVGSSSEKKIVKGFYHRSFCSFFRANKILDAMETEKGFLAEALSKPLRNDITDFVRSGIGEIHDRKKLERIQHTLMNLYIELVKPGETDLSVGLKKEVGKLDEDDVFYLKNELVYLITRYPRTSVKVDKFVQMVAHIEEDPYMRLDIAYGAVLTGPYELALEYAKKLMPGTEEDFVNRSWTVAYFGDVQAVPYHYRDTEQAPWTKAREARMKRLQSRKEKAVRFRILDLPLLYCFYESREWKDATLQDYEIIRQTEIEGEYYTEEEKQFLKEQKEKLLAAFEEEIGIK